VVKSDKFAGLVKSAKTDQFSALVKSGKTDQFSGLVKTDKFATLVKSDKTDQFSALIKSDKFAGLVKLDRFPCFSYDVVKWFLISIPIFSIPIGLQKHTIPIPMFFLFLCFSYPIFQREPKGLVTVRIAASVFQ
jgi:hypothetical protein